MVDGRIDSYVAPVVYLGSELLHSESFNWVVSYLAGISSNASSRTKKQAAKGLDGVGLEVLLDLCSCSS